MSVERNSQLTKLSTPGFSQRRQWAGNQSIGFLIQQSVENVDVVSLAVGLVDQQSLPVEETRKAFEKLFGSDERARQALQYGTTPGAEPFREELRKHLARLENCEVEQLGIDVDQLMMTTGSQQLLSLVGEMLFDPGDLCLVAAPTYFVFLDVLSGLGVRTVPVKANQNGMCMDSLENELNRIDSEGELDRVKAIYIVSYYENPTGISLGAERRPQLIEIAQKWSRQHRIFVIEDAAYRELRYDGPALPSVWSYDKSKQTVILAQTFSKSYSPGLRVGFGVLPVDLVEAILNRKSNEDFGSSNFGQSLLCTVLHEGLYQPHVKHVCDSYRKKRDCMLTAAKRYFANLDGVEWVHPHGGLYVWMTLPENVETGFQSDLFQRATKIDKVMYVPGELCYPSDSPLKQTNQMRLSYGVQDEEGIALGMQRLAAAVRAVL